MLFHNLTLYVPDSIDFPEYFITLPEELLALKQEVSKLLFIGPEVLIGISLKPSTFTYNSNREFLAKTNFSFLILSCNTVLMEINFIIFYSLLEQFTVEFTVRRIF